MPIKSLTATLLLAFAVLAAPAAARLPDDPGFAPPRNKPAGGWVKRQWSFLPCGSLCDSPARGTLRESRGGIGVPAAWGNLKLAGRPGGEGVTVAVVDTGIAYRTGVGITRSPDLNAGRFVPGYDFVDDDRDPSDLNGHGTHVASTIGAQTGNARGMTGIAYRAKLMPVRVLNSLGNGREAEIARGIRFAARNGADVINLSLNFGCGNPAPGVVSAVRFARRRGSLLVASAGNRGCVAAPAGIRGVLTVGGTTEGGCLGSYSPRSPLIDVVAPGGGIPVPACAEPGARPILQLTLSRDRPRHFGLPRHYAGTSEAAAHVSGLAALVIASGVAGRNPSPAQVVRQIKTTARDLGLAREDQGTGLIDAGAATAPR